MQNLFFIALVFMSALLGSVAHAEASQKKPIDTKIANVSLHKKLLGASVTSAATLDIDGEVAILYGAGNKVLFRLGNNKPVVIANDKVTDKGVWLHKNNKKIVCTVVG